MWTQGYIVRVSWHILVSLFCISQSSYAQESVTLYGEPGAESTKLYWEVKEWASDWRGFVICKRQENQWVKMTDEPIFPGFYYKRNWDDIGVTGRLRDSVIEQLNAVTKDGVSEKLPEDVIDLFQIRGGLGTGDHIAMKTDYSIVLASGFGMVDGRYRASENLEYGIFVVRDDGSVDKSPIDRFVTNEYFQSLGNAVQSYSLEFNEENVSISWELTKEAYKNLGLFGYHLYRRPVGSNDDWQKLTRVPMWGENEGSKFIFDYMDSPRPQDDLLEYAIEPITVFQKKLERRKLVVERPPKYTPPVALSVGRSSNYLYVLNWKFPEDALLPENFLFNIERAQFMESQIKELGLEMLPEDDDYKTVAIIGEADARSWLDPLRIRESLNVFYRVTLVDSKTGDRYQSAPLYKSLRPNSPPKPVSKLTARLLPTAGKNNAKVRLSWLNEGEDAHLTDYFMVASDRNSDEVIEHSSDQIEGNHFELKIGDVRKVCTFEVTPVGFDLLKGDARQVKLYIPKLRLDPFPEGAKVDYMPHLNELASTIRWEYGDRSDLSGFRIRHLKTKEIIADTDEIGPNASEWVWRGETLQSEAKIPIEIEAVGVFDYITSLPEIAYLDNAPLHYGRDYSLPKAELRNVKVYRHNDKKLLALKWDAWEEDLYGDIKRLAIGPAKADKYTPIPLYRIGWHQYIESENGKLVVEIPDYLDLSGEVDMRLVPLYVDDKGRATIKGRFAEFTVNLDETNGGGSESQEDTVAESLVPLEQSLKWETLLIEEQAGLTDEFMAGIFEFQNIGDAPIEITGMKSSCGCTTAQMDKKLYLPGERGEILATFEFEGRTGRQTKVVDVYVKGYDDPVRLVLKTTIPRVLSIKPSNQVWRLNEAAKAKYSLIEVEVEDGPVKIEKVISNNPNVNAEIEPGEGESPDRLKILPLKTDERLRARIDLVTNYPADAPKTYKVYVQVK